MCVMFPVPGKWYKHQLTYQIVNWPWYLSQHQVRQAVKAAFELWSNVSSLTFSEVTEGPVNIRLAFFDGEHNDGARHAFDGPGAKPFTLVSFVNAKNHSALLI